jgi:hypothetical protein
LAIGLASSAPGETQNDSKADKPVPAPAAKSSKAAKSSQPAKTSGAAKTSKTAKSGEGPAKETIQTPFGPMTVGEDSEQPPTARDFAADPFVSAEEKGDLVVFRRKTPFGSQVWKKKKSELTADEQALLAAGRPEPPKTQPAKAEAPAKDSSKPLPPGPR